MKQLFIIAAMLCGTAQAGTVATAANGGGGLLVLTDVVGSCKNGKIAYSTVPNASVGMGCWFTDDNFVFIRWSDGDTRTYPFSIWTMKANPKQNNL